VQAIGIDSRGKKKRNSGIDSHERDETCKARRQWKIQSMRL